MSTPYLIFGTREQKDKDPCRYLQTRKLEDPDFWISENPDLRPFADTILHPRSLQTPGDRAGSQRPSMVCFQDRPEIEHFQDRPFQDRPKSGNPGNPE